MDIFTVVISRSALKDISKLPLHISSKLQVWIDMVGNDGLREARKTIGYHDEPLKGKRVGQRSIRLSRAYRAIYMINKHDIAEFIEVVEVNKHEYKK
ncbi:MAG: type II toxin-antitoxin system mRNA interferase toxin, RelE/StbE family [Coxiellaceae bacterium]|nr:type II toxin-antitoxin system mRNA interferase toxin, RelE/StbE family [Coxiellaceae bacterium]